ncbi:hypothetical protein GCM10017691_29230 [Pseudonocardia petroleophila]|uniref:Uncharacterized protein n=1 Tax=Pseudonocardia petroleophila TaxID=37331 RepID=A0A7G7MEJ9_9PSEU|nr:hypothetical protein [Pseudonocardia petroleophila]QNG51210.1 hypothetical protein H6H00_24080 [Pseudonocardia petroleophila]
MPGTEDDVPADPALADSRETGGSAEDTPGDAAGDSTSTTGTDRTEEFVGRVAGDDAGYAGETGAERRAQ